MLHVYELPTIPSPIICTQLGSRALTLVPTLLALIFNFEFMSINYHTLQKQTNKRILCFFYATEHRSWYY